MHDMLYLIVKCCDCYNEGTYCPTNIAFTKEEEAQKFCDEQNKNYSPIADTEGGTMEVYEYRVIYVDQPDQFKESQ